jgi:hypothetical protein
MSNKSKNKNKNNALGSCNGKVNIFAARCETLDDSTRFLNKFITASEGDVVNFIINTKGYDSGCQVILNTHKSIDYVQFIISLVSDLHTMKDTLQDIKKYTGER